MKVLDLNAYGVSEMSQQELVETNGGWLLGFGPLRIGVHFGRHGAGNSYHHKFGGNDCFGGIWW